MGMGHPHGRRFSPLTRSLVAISLTVMVNRWIEAKLEHLALVAFATASALTISASLASASSKAHPRPPMDEDADHLLVRIIFCPNGSVEMELICEPII